MSKENNFTLEDYVRILNQYQELQQENRQLKEQLGNRIVEFGYKETKYKSVLDETREQLKKIKPDLDFEPWSFYTISGDKLFGLLQILDKVNNL